MTQGRTDGKIIFLYIHKHSFLLSLIRIMGIIALIFFGAIVGRLSGFFVSKKGGVLRNILIGIVGSFIGGGIAQFFGFGGITGFNLYSILIGVIGSVILVSIVHAIKTT